MNRLRAALLLLLTLSMVAVAGSDVLLDALLQRPAAPSGPSVVPDRFLRRWDPLTVFLVEARGPTAGGPEDAAERIVRMDPPHPGAWTWLDERTLQFRPAEPWPALSHVGVRVFGLSTDLFTLMAPPVDTEPSRGATGLSEVRTVTLSFADPVPPEALARRTSIELRPLPGLGDDGVRVLDARDFEVKALDRASPDDRARYALVLQQPIPLGTSARVRVALSVDDTAAEAVSELVFSTAEPFRARALGCPGATVPVGPAGTRFSADQPLRCGRRTVTVEFTAALGSVGPVEGRNLLRFEPAVEGLSFSTSGRRLEVSGAFQDDTPYAVTLSPAALSDRKGRPLELTGPSVVHLYFPRRPAYLKWRAGQGIAERLGPQRVPIEGRRSGQVDLRVYAVDPLNRELWPFPSRPVSVDESVRPAGPGEEPAKLSATGRPSESQLRERLKLLGSPGVSTLVDLPLAEDPGAASFGLDLTPHLATLSGRRAPGHYLVGIRRLDGGPSRDWMRVQVTDLALTTVETGGEVRFFVTSLDSGQPVAGATVRVEGAVSQNRTTSWSTVINLRTDAAGSAVWQAPGRVKGRSVQVERITVQKQDDVLVLDARMPPDRFQHGHWQDGGGRWLGWAFDTLDARMEQRKTLVHLFTERPVYRPGQVVHLKGYLRTRLHGQLDVPKGTGTVVVHAPSGAEWRLPVELTGAGSFYAKWSEAEVPTGTYRAWLERGKVRYGSVEFQLEAYRLPTFEVELEAAGDRVVVENDQPFDVRATASYYAGGKVAARPVRWQVTQLPYTWAPEMPEGFYTSSDGRYARSSRFDATPALSREATTDRTGQAVLSLDPGVEPTAQPRTYVIEATVTDADEQTVTAVHRVHAVPAFVLGLKVPRVLDDADSLDAEVLVVGADGAPVPDRDVTLRVLHRQWHSVLQASDFSDGVARYVTDVVDQPHTERTLRSTAAPLPISVPLEEAGVYVVELEARDRLGRVAVVSVDLYAAGDDPVTWRKPEAGVFDLTADAASYVPGDTAKILIRSPFQKGQALVVVEAPDGNRVQALPIRGGQATLALPIEEGWVPRLPVHVLLRRGRTQAKAAPAGLDLGKPQSLGSTLWLRIRPEEHTVTVELEHPEKAMPGETVPVTVRLADPDGAPLSGEVTLWLVDQAVLSLGTEQRLDPRPDFLPDRRSWLSAHDTRNLAFGTLPYAQMPGGDGEEEEGDDVLEKTTIRKDFRPVPYYEPHLQVPASGTRTVQVQLPDNLTVFKLRAKAASGAERFGVGKSSLRVRLPVLVQPDLPRFVRPGDALEVAALGRVVEGTGGAGTAQLKVEGLTVGGDTTASLQWDADLATRVAWPVTVPTPPAGEGGALTEHEVVVTIGARRSEDGAADALEVRLPLRDDRRPQHLRVLGDLSPGGAVEIAALPEGARPGSVQRAVVLADHPGLVRMAAAMDVLVQRPARSTGERLARARGWLGLGSLRGPLGLTRDGLVDAAVADALGWLPSVLDSRELVSSWPGGRGQVTLTAEALQFLAEAAEAGYPVDSRLQAALTRALTSSLRSDYRYFLDGESWLERARSLEALATAGTFSEAYFSELSRSARLLGPEGGARVLLAATRADQAGSAAAVSLAERLESEITLTLYQGEERYGGLKSRRTDRNPLILPSESTALASITRALTRAVPASEKLPHAVDALVSVGGEDGWGHARANAEAMLALGERLQTSSGPAVRAVVREGSETPLETGRDTPVVRHTSDHAGVTTVAHGDGPEGVVFATTRYLPAAPGSAEEPAQRGFVVQRTWLVQSERGPPKKLPLERGGTELAVVLGAVIEEHVQVVNPEGRTYVAIEVPLAAGVEPLNPALATAPPEAQPSAADTRRATWVSFGDDRVVYHFEELPKGTYDFRFRTRATTAGRFVQPAAVAELVYDPAVVGNSAGAEVVVSR